MIMKKLFTMMAIVATASMAFAQTSVQPEVVKSAKVMAPKAKAMPFKAESLSSKTTAPKRSLETGNYYTAPAGAMYIGYGKDGMGYSNMVMVTTGLADAVFTNMSSDPASAVWTWNGQDAAAYDLVDENNNFVWYGFPNLSGSFYYFPTLTTGTDSYNIGDYNTRTSANGIQSPAAIDNLTFTDSHFSNSQLYGYSSTMSSQYLFGSGNAELEDEEGNPVQTTAYGVRQHYPKPMTPLYVEDIYLDAFAGNGNTTPLKNGAILTMKITGDNGDVIATLTSTADDFLPWEGQVNTNDQIYGLTTFGTLTFSMKEEDPMSGDMVAAPFTIDQPFTVEITGFDNPDVNVALYGYTSIPEQPLERARVLTKDASGNEYSFGYGSGLSLPVNFTGLFDNIMVEDVLNDGENDYPNSNVVRISEDGTLSQLDNMLDVGPYVGTATPWYDENYNPNYYYQVATSSDGTGEWVYSCDAYTDYWESNFINILSFTASACPAGEGRWAVVNIVGRGVTSATPIILLQGTATLDDVEMSTGITNVTTGNSDKKFDPNAPIYNLNGQRVSKSATGILIQNGRKFIKK